MNGKMPRPQGNTKEELRQVAEEMRDTEDYLHRKATMQQHQKIEHRLSELEQGIIFLKSVCLRLNQISVTSSE